MTDVMVLHLKGTVIAVVFAAGGLVSCSESTPPEQQIRQLNQTAEEAARAKDVAALKDLIADGYRDERGYDRQAVIRLAQLSLLRNKSVHLYSITKSLQILDESNAVAEILVAMAGKPIDEPEQLLNLRAELVRFNVRYVGTGKEWKVAAVEWRRAKVDDFL